MSQFFPVNPTQLALPTPGMLQPGLGVNIGQLTDMAYKQHQMERQADQDRFRRFTGLMKRYEALDIDPLNEKNALVLDNVFQEYGVDPDKFLDKATTTEDFEDQYLKMGKAINDPRSRRVIREGAYLNRLGVLATNNPAFFGRNHELFTSDLEEVRTGNKEAFHINPSKYKEVDVNKALTDAIKGVGYSKEFSSIVDLGNGVSALKHSTQRDPKEVEAALATLTKSNPGILDQLEMDARRGGLENPEDIQAYQTQILQDAALKGSAIEETVGGAYKSGLSEQDIRKFANDDRRIGIAGANLELSRKREERMAEAAGLQMQLVEERIRKMQAEAIVKDRESANTPAGRNLGIKDADDFRTQYAFKFEEESGIFSPESTTGKLASIARQELLDVSNNMEQARFTRPDGEALTFQEIKDVFSGVNVDIGPDNLRFTGNGDNSIIAEDNGQGYYKTFLRGALRFTFPDDDKLYTSDPYLWRSRKEKLTENLSEMFGIAKKDVLINQDASKKKVIVKINNPKIRTSPGYEQKVNDVINTNNYIIERQKKIQEAMKNPNVQQQSSTVDPIANLSEFLQGGINEDNANSIVDVFNSYQTPTNKQANLGKLATLPTSKVNPETMIIISNSPTDRYIYVGDKDGKSVFKSVESFNDLNNPK